MGRHVEPNIVVVVVGRGIIVPKFPSRVGGGRTILHTTISCPISYIPDKWLLQEEYLLSAHR